MLRSLFYDQVRAGTDRWAFLPTACVATRADDKKLQRADKIHVLAPLSI